MARRKNEFQTIRCEGGLLPPDLLRRVINPKEKIPGTKPEDYGLPQSERINDTITQSWNRLRRHWSEFQEARQKLPEGEAATGLTNDKWSLPLLRELGFGLLPTSPGPEIKGRTYAINRFIGRTAIHLVGCGLSLDRRAAGVRGAAVVNPHGLVQDFLNRAEGYLWGIVSNGLRFRILRDNQALSRQSYLEFDLEAMFSGEVFSDFVLLWLIVHATRFAPKEESRPESCWLEQWTKLANEQGTRALGDLRTGVERALEILGQGFVGHPRNTNLREALRSGVLSLNDFHGQLLRFIYRLIFLFVAEDRILDDISLLHPRDESEQGRQARERFALHYSTARLRDLAFKIKGSRHGDLWNQFNLLVGALSGEDRFAAARGHLALPILGSFLWDRASTSALNASTLAGSSGAELSNADFLEALRHLAFTRQDKVLRPVDYRNLGSEELGGIYETLLALTPQISGDGNRFTFAEFAGNERKTSGSYYTPDSLVQCLLDSALDPVVEEAIKGKSGMEAEKAILSLMICDPAVGSGHFLVGAAHRLARHLARARSLAQGESEPSPLLYQHALRDVIGRCLYGVDVNPMAAELCRVSLWLEALEPGKPLSFLDQHIRVGNSLLGTTPELIAAGLPDEAFTPIEGDDKKVCSALKKRNKPEREGQRDMLYRMVAESRSEYNSIESRTRGINEAPDNTIAEIQRKSEQFRHLVVSPEYRHAQQVADAWCAAFVWRKNQNSLNQTVTTDTIRRLEEDPNALSPGQKAEVERLAAQYRLFHWHLVFPEVFARGGFDCVLGNPPWERVKIQEKEWFAERSPAIAAAPNAADRKRLIEALKSGDSVLFQQFLEDSRKAEGESHLLRHSGRYPLCGRGDINVYTVFAEGMRSLLCSTGAMGAVLPSGLATDDTTKHFFGDLILSRALWSFFEFENEGFFPGAGQGHMLRFALTTIGGRSRCAKAADYVFQAKAVSDLANAEQHFTLSAEDIALLNPNTRTCPIFRSRKDAEITKAIYRRVPVLIREAQGGSPEENPWGITFSRMFDMANDSHLFRTREQLEAEGWHLEGNIFLKDGEEYLPLYEAKMIQQYNHRHGDFADGEDGKRAHILPEVPADRLSRPDYKAMPFYWVHATSVRERLGANASRPCLFGWRDVTDARASARTTISSAIPMAGAGDTWLLMFSSSGTALSILLVGCLDSFASDYPTRQKVAGLHLKYHYFKQLAVLPPTIYWQPHTWSAGTDTLRDWLVPRMLELTYTAWDLEPFAQDCGWSGPPFRWDEERRFLLRCELDAAFFHLYLPAAADGQWKPARVAEGAVRDETPEELAELKRHFPTPRDAVAYIMETFPIVRRKEEEKHGEYRTKRVILEVYDEMAEAMRTGTPYQTRLAPPPGPPADEKGNFLPLPEWNPGQPKPDNWPPHIHPPKGANNH